MMCKVALRPSAERDLDRLFAFVAHDNLPASLRLKRSLREAVLRLGEQLFLGAPVSRAERRAIRWRLKRLSKGFYRRSFCRAPLVARVTRL